MQITLSPIRGLPGQSETTISVNGDTITVDGMPYDLSAVPEGGEATPEGDDHPFIGAITRQAGEIYCTVRVRLDDTAMPNQPRDPAHWAISATSGAVEIPAIRKPTEQEDAI